MTEIATQYFHEQNSIPGIFIRWYFYKLTVYSFLLYDKYFLVVFTNSVSWIKLNLRHIFHISANFKRMCMYFTWYFCQFLSAMSLPRTSKDLNFFLPSFFLLHWDKILTKSKILTNKPISSIFPKNSQINSQRIPK